MTKPKAAPVVLPQDLLCDISRMQVAEHGLLVVPYFFDSKTAERLKSDYFYIGWRV